MQIPSSSARTFPVCLETFPISHRLYTYCWCRLVEEYPDRGVAWFGVGCYYLCTRQFETARRYFGKATSMDNAFAAAWIGFGHSFAFQDESDQVQPCRLFVSSRASYTDSAARVQLSVVLPCKVACKLCPTEADQKTRANLPMLAAPREMPN